MGNSGHSVFEASVCWLLQGEDPCDRSAHDLEPPEGQLWTVGRGRFRV
jgi:hypothetical protein